MRKSRARLVSVGFVIGTALASGAYAGLSALDNPATTRPIPPSTPGAVVFSVRNTGTNSVRVGSASPMGPANVGCGSIVLTPYNVTPPYDLAPDTQAQYIATTTGFTATSSCMFAIPVMDLVTSMMTTTDVQVVFNIDGSNASQVDLQAQNIDFGSQTTSFEDQLVMLSDYGGVTYGQYTLSIAGPNPDGSLHFVGGCSGTSCTVAPTSNGGGRAQATLECQALGSNTVSAMLQVLGSGSGFPLASSNVLCRPAVNPSSRIAIVEQPSITLSGPAGVMTAAGSAHVMLVSGGSNAVTSVALSGGPFTFVPPTNCSGLGPCLLSPPLPLPPIETVSFACTPVMGMPQAATLTVLGSDTVNDVATTTVNCIASSSGPLMTVSPNMIGPVSSPVGMPITVAQAITIGNAGDQPLTGVTVEATSSEWTADACDPATPCSVGSGSAQLVHMTFTPSAWGNQGATLNVMATSDPAHPGSVSLAGTGLGAILNPPMPNSYDFGSISRGQSRSHMFSISETGNAGTMLTFSNTMPEIMPPASLALAAGGTGTFSISCESANAGSFVDTVTIDADQSVYMGSPQTIGVMCTVADTDVQIAPATLDFHEVRIHTSPAPTIDVTITNAGAAPAVLHRVALSDDHGGQLGLSPAISSDVTLDMGDVQHVTLTLGTDTEVDLTGTKLLVDVDLAHLSPAIDGKVVTAKSHVAPAMLDLGTACVGAQVSGTEMLINDGTATLQLMAPTMDQGFSVLAQTPQNYPSNLPAGQAASVQVKPAASAVGTVMGTLTWKDSVPSEYMVPVTVDYIPSGTAVSPATLDFGQVPVQVRSDQQSVTLQNCDTVATMVMLGPVKGLEGPARAWDVEPSTGSYVLAPGEQLTLAVAFVPQEPGAHHGRLSVDVGGTTSTVDLYGDATGPNLDHTSFYACTCSQGGPAGGWPIALAVLVIVRRRRGSSSPR